jgi:hypothetical protein
MERDQECGKARRKATRGLRPKSGECCAQIRENQTGQRMIDHSDISHVDVVCFVAQSNKDRQARIYA